ncbi:MAG: DUF3106 domain-containing protein [Gammaproteobacteria bacterium]|nr:DUF3106 domain-containing protein [Gammaproteobacteria bacterium]
MSKPRSLDHMLGTVLLSLLLLCAQQVAVAGDAAILYPEQLHSYMRLVADKHGGEQRWKSMTPEQRARARERYEHFKQLSPEEQARIRERYEHFNQLPPEQQEELREQWNKMSPEERRKALNKKRRERHSQEE